jgi:hypothetical protein
MVWWLICRSQFHQYPPDLLHLTFNPPSNNITRLPVMTEVHRNHYFRCRSPINIIANRKAWASRWCVDGKSMGTSGWCLRCRLLLWCTIEDSFFCKWNCVFQIQITTHVDWRLPQCQWFSAMVIDSLYSLSTRSARDNTFTALFGRSFQVYNASFVASPTTIDEAHIWWWQDFLKGCFGYIIICNIE